MPTRHEQMMTEISNEEILQLGFWCIGCVACRRAGNNSRLMHFRLWTWRCEVMGAAARTAVNNFASSWVHYFFRRKMIDIRRMHTSYRDCLVFAMSSAARDEIVVFFSFDVGGNEMLYSTGGLACNHHQLGIFGCNVALEYMSLIGNCKHYGYVSWDTRSAECRIYWPVERSWWTRSFDKQANYRSCTFYQIHRIE